MIIAFEVKKIEFTCICRYVFLIFGYLLSFLLWYLAFYEQKLNRRNLFWFSKRLIFSTRLYFLIFFYMCFEIFCFLLTEVLLKDAFSDSIKDLIFLYRLSFFEFFWNDLSFVHRSSTEGTFSDSLKDWFFLQNWIFWCKCLFVFGF